MDEGELSNDDKMMAMLAHLSTFALAFVAPALLYAIKGKESKFVAYHAIQALIFQTANLVFVLVIGLPLIFCTFGLAFPLLFLGWIPPIMAAMNANAGKWEGYPLVSHIGRDGL